MRCNNLKKIKMIPLLCITMILASGCSGNEKRAEQSVSHSFYWGGTICSGSYTGKMENGKPAGRGSFHGYLMRDGKEQDQVSYDGGWKEGRVAGTGTFVNISDDITYKGKFKNNWKHGKFVVKSGDSEIYEKVSFYKDIPYGIAILHRTEDDEIAGYDRYYQGVRVSEIIAEAKQFDYAELMYKIEDHYYEKIYLDCEVEDKSLREVVINPEEPLEEDQEKELTAELKVRDKGGNFYLVSYNIEYPERAKNFMPDVEAGEKIRVYGYVKGMTGQEEDAALSMRYPLIEGVTAVKEEEEIDIQNLSYTHENFLDYPYEYQGKKAELTGHIRQIGTDTEGQLYLIIESDTYSEEGSKYYICSYDSRHTEEHGKMPMIGDEADIKGKMERVYLIPTEEDFTLFPRIAISEILLK